MDKTNYLVQQVKKGDQNAFSILYDDYSGAIYGVIRNIVKNETDANDVLQDVFIKAWQKIEQYNPEKGRFYTWLFRIARNTSLNHLRAKKPENQTGDFSVYDSVLKGGRLNVDTLDLTQKISKLDKKYQEVLELVYLNGFTHQQAHKILGLPIGTIKTRLRKAIQALGKIYKDDTINYLFILLIISGNG